MDEQKQWQVVQGRDAAYDGRFVYAVRSTGIYCRPSCPSRRPGRDQVLFFDAPADAEASGYRACRRCRPTGASSDLDRRWVAQVCRYLDDHPDRVPSLQELSERFGFSPYHLQRTFKQIVGVTPRQYAAERRLTRFKAALKEGETVTEAIYTAGFGSSRRGLWSRTGSTRYVTGRLPRRRAGLGGALCCRPLPARLAVGRGDAQRVVRRAPR